MGNCYQCYPICPKENFNKQLSPISNNHLVIDTENITKSNSNNTHMVKANIDKNIHKKQNNNDKSLNHGTTISKNEQSEENNEVIPIIESSKVNNKNLLSLGKSKIINKNNNNNTDLEKTKQENRKLKSENEKKNMIIQGLQSNALIIKAKGKSKNKKYI